MPYIDNPKLKKGQVISPALFRAIENSMFCISVLSQKDASSSWCLKELVKILQSKACNTERVLPIFYDVDPSNVRKQKGDFGKRLRDLLEISKGKRMNGVKILRLAKSLKGWENRFKVWRKALIQVSNISGWDSLNRHEPALIEKIINAVSNELFHRYSGDEENLAGINYRIHEVMSRLCVASLDVVIIGIWGMGGIGKTTLANAVYNRISHQFDRSEIFRNQGLINLKQELLSLLVNNENLNLKGCTSIMGKLCSKKVLIVLDNVKDGVCLMYIDDMIGYISAPQPSSVVLQETTQCLKTFKSREPMELDYLLRISNQRVP